MSEVKSNACSISGKWLNSVILFNVFKTWNFLPFKDYKRAGDVKISSYAKLEIDSALGIKEDKSDNEAEVSNFLLFWVSAVFNCCN